jgi:hypothetical protein
MSGFYLAINTQSKDFRQSEGRSDMQTCASGRQIFNVAWKLLPRRAEFNNAAPEFGSTNVFSTVEHL